MELRRIVTGERNGRSTIVDDGPPPRTHDFRHVPGHASAIVWASDPPAGDPGGEDPTPRLRSVIRGPGSATFLVVQLPPDSVFTAEDFDADLAFAEQDRVTPGLLAHFEPGTGFHATPTVDYMVMLRGELWLVLDEGETRVAPGDVVVQNGTRHAWQNRGETPATFAVVMVGARPVTSRSTSTS